MGVIDYQIEENRLDYDDIRQAIKDCIFGMMDAIQTTFSSLICQHMRNRTIIVVQWYMPSLLWIGKNLNIQLTISHQSGFFSLFNMCICVHTWMSII